jgi:hypothetical protein
MWLRTLMIPSMMSSITLFMAPFSSKFTLRKSIADGHHLQDRDVTKCYSKLFHCHLIVYKGQSAVSITKASMVLCAQWETPVVPSQVASQDNQFNGPPYILYLLVMPKAMAAADERLMSQTAHAGNSRHLMVTPLRMSISTQGKSHSVQGHERFEPSPSHGIGDLCLCTVQSVVIGKRGQDVPFDFGSS